MLTSHKCVALPGFLLHPFDRNTKCQTAVLRIAETTETEITAIEAEGIIETAGGIIDEEAEVEAGVRLEETAATDGTIIGTREVRLGTRPIADIFLTSYIADSRSYRDGRRDDRPAAPGRSSRDDDRRPPTDNRRDRSERDDYSRQRGGGDSRDGRDSRDRPSSSRPAGRDAESSHKSAREPERRDIPSKNTDSKQQDVPAAGADAGEPEEEEDDEAAMAAMLGFGGFGTTKVDTLLFA